MKNKLLSIIVILSLVLGLFVSVQPLQSAKAAGPNCYVDDTALGANDGSSWIDAFIDLQAALIGVGCTTIYVAEGTYYPTSGTDRAASFRLGNGLEVYGGFPDGGGTQDPDAHPTILSGDIGVEDITDNSYHVVSGLNVDGSAILDGFTIMAGNADGQSLDDRNGGGIFISNGSPTLQNLMITGNFAHYDGGGIFISNGSPILHNLMISGNFADGYGGGICLQVGSPLLTQVILHDNYARIYGGGFSSNGNPTLTYVDFINNTSDAGGGMFHYYGMASLENVFFTENQADGSGGGLYITQGSATITDSQFNSNESLNRNGGGLIVWRGTVDIADSTFDSNRSLETGGGISVTGGSGTFTNLTLSYNHVDGVSGDGGGIYYDRFDPFTGDDWGISSSFTNLLINGNTAQDAGGGMYIANGDPSLTEVTFLSNQSVAHGGGMYSQGNPNLSNLVFTGNSSDSSGGGAYIWGLPSLNDITFTSNQATAGGGLFLWGSPTLSHVIFTDNTATNNGGGMYAQGNPILEEIEFNSNHAGSGGGMFSDGNPTLTNVTFTANEAGINGGGIFSSSGDAHLNNVTFTENRAIELGGGLKLESNASLTDVTFTANEAVDGGGMHVYGGDAILNGCLFDSNLGSIDMGQGGGLWVGASASAIIQNSTFSSNSAWMGGGLYAWHGSLNMADCLLDNNMAIGGGGLNLDDALPSFFTNMTVTGNQADLTTGNGGGLSVFGPSHHIFTNLLLTGNSAANGGGMSHYTGSIPEFVNTTIHGNVAESLGSSIYIYNASPTLTNAVVWGNIGTVPGPDIVSEGAESAPSISFSILEDGCPSGTSCANIISSNPLFIDEASHDFHLQAGSPAINFGDNSILPADTFDQNENGNITETIPYDLDGNQRIVSGQVDLGPYEAQLPNTSWPMAAELALVGTENNVSFAQADQALSQLDESRWYKFIAQPDSKLIITLTDLPANYDLVLFTDIAQAFQELNTPQDLAQLSAEFAPDTFSPDTFSPDTFSPDTFSPDTFSPDTFSPDTFSPDTFSPDTFSPDTFSPDTFSPDTFSPDTFSPDTFSPDTFSPDTFSPDTFSPDTFSPDTFSPDTFSSAQTRSLITGSSHEGSLSEGILINTWTKGGYFYIRVRGRNGMYDPESNFHLQVMQLSGSCSGVSPILPDSNTIPVAGNYQTLILTNPGKIEGTVEEMATLQANLNNLAAATNGLLVNVAMDDRVSAATAQAEAYPQCVYAKNLEAYAVKDIVDGFRALNPLEYIVLVGNDQSIPYFRYPDNALLASETGYSPPVRDDTTSQASLKMGYFLTQDTYGASIELSILSQIMPIPELAVGRLVETASDIDQMIQAYLSIPNGTISPSNALVTGYDFLTDTANAIDAELTAGLGANTVDSLIMDNNLSPEDPSSWTANDLQNLLFSDHHDLVFLAGHFSASTALAADYQTKLTTSDVLNSQTDFANNLVYSPGCHSGYNIVNEHDVPNVTKEPDWAQMFNSRGATFIGGTGYQYGDTDFIEYSELLYLEFTRQLRYGNDPVAVGNALVQAKQAFLAQTSVMRGIHWKSLLEATLFGLPMLMEDFPNRISPPFDTTIVPFTSTFTTDPGLQLGLEFADINLSPIVIENNVTLDVISSAGGLPEQVTATYLEGSDGVVVNPAEPVLPLDMLNVTYPTDSGFVLRGVGWRGGDYTDLPDHLPLTGAATTELRAPHPAFFSDVFYPIRPWNINYFDALGSMGGPTRLALMPAQYKSSSPASLTGTLRQFTELNFRLYYSNNISSYNNPDHDWTNTPALAAPPNISAISSAVNPYGTVSFNITVIGEPSAGIQEVWIVYTGESGSLYGSWLPLDLTQDPEDSRHWIGTLPIGDTPAANIRFIVQAVNGVGVVTMMTNLGEYYRIGVDPGAPPQGQTPVLLTLTSLPISNDYGSMATFTALATQNGSPIAGIPVIFRLGEQSRLAVTGNEGIASTNFFLLARPDEYTLSASIEGDNTYQPANASSSFEVIEGISTITLEPGTRQVVYGSSLVYSATLTSGGLPLALKPVALTLTSDGNTLYTEVVETDYAGRAHWQVPAQTAGSYSVTAWFGQQVSTELDLSNPYYLGSSAIATLVIYPFYEFFDGFFSPVDNPPDINEVKAGRAVPIKFSLGGDYGIDIFAEGYPQSTPTTQCNLGTIEPIEETVNAGHSNLTYDPLTGQYIYIWKTDKNWARTCQVLTLKFIDGTEKTAYFQFTK